MHHCRDDKTTDKSNRPWYNEKVLTAIDTSNLLSHTRARGAEFVNRMQEFNQEQSPENRGVETIISAINAESPPRFFETVGREVLRMLFEHQEGNLSANEVNVDAFNDRVGRALERLGHRYPDQGTGRHIRQEGPVVQGNGGDYGPHENIPRRPRRRPRREASVVDGYAYDYWPEYSRLPRTSAYPPPRQPFYRVDLSIWEDSYGDDSREYSIPGGATYRTPPPSSYPTWSLEPDCDLHPPRSGYRSANERSDGRLPDGYVEYIPATPGPPRRERRRYDAHRDDEMAPRPGRLPVPAAGEPEGRGPVRSPVRRPAQGDGPADSSSEG
ncbi:hypothetical protein BDY21DRAFT_395564 [Lineolata rhizophorae]|uniref:Uncharacterized protein n=1 Tax=Lineolata rhizophorae TaxID=578093 RepID=A0A6A6NUJ3_9PEZI|nr:hypothetical protein BDY21DRAFT_395564 [Lineolata rhizophorae]